MGSLLASSFKGNLSNAVPGQFGELFSDPQRLLSPESLAMLRERIDQASPGAADEVIQSAQIALGDAVTDIFLIGMAIVSVGLAIGLFMPRVRMRGREELMAEARGEKPPDEGESDEPGSFGVEPEEAGAPGGK